MVDTLERLPELMRAERERRGLSLRGAADEIGYGHTRLRDFEHRLRSPTLPNVIKMIQWLERSA